MTTIYERKQYPMVDLVKMIAAILIVAGHVRALGFGEGTPELIWYYYGEIFSRNAVPFFLLSTGFFLFRRTDYSNAMTAAWKSAKKLLSFYLLWTIIYLPLILYTAYINENGIWVGLLLALRDTIFQGSQVHLWYLPAAAVAILMIGFLYSKNLSPLKIVLIGTGLYLVGLLFQGYHFLIHPIEQVSLISSIMEGLKMVVVTTRNGVFEGTLLIALGLYIGKEKPSVKPTLAMILSIVFTILLAVEVYLIKPIVIYQHEYYLFSVPATAMLFLFCLNMELKDKPIYAKFRSESALVYFIHFWPFLVLEKLFSAVFPLGNYSPILFIAVTVLSILFAMIVVRLSEKWKWLKKLY